MSDMRSATAANRDEPGQSGPSDRSGDIAGSARALVRSEDLEEVLVVAASAIGETLAGEAVLRVRATRHDLHASASGVLPPSALSPDVRAVLSALCALDQPPAGPTVDDVRGILLESSGQHASCRAWVEAGRPAASEVARDAGHRAVQRTVAELLMHSLAQAVDRIVTVDRFRRNEANLEQAVESHRLVGQAMGILIERHRIVSEDAFEVLRRASQDHNIKLREVARRVIETGVEPDEVV